MYAGDERWQGLDVPAGRRLRVGPDIDLRAQAPLLRGHALTPAPLADVRGARVLARSGDSVTTDHISPAGNIRRDGPAGRWLIDGGVDPADFNSYGSRRGNHEVMIRGTFANIRLRNQLAPGTEGGVTRHLPDGEQMSIYDAAKRYQADGVPLVILAGKEYGSGSSRDWAAKGTALLGVRAVLAESFERIHRSNLVGMGVLPLQFKAGRHGRVARPHRRGGVRHHRPGGPGRRRAASPGADGDGRRPVILRRAADRHAQGGGVLPPRRASCPTCCASSDVRA